MTPHNRAILVKLDKLTKKYNPCNIRPGTYMKQTGSGLQWKETEVKGLVCTGGTPCCTGCTHLKTTGCSVSSPACRFWFCWKVRKTAPLIFRIKVWALFLRYNGVLRWRHDQHVVSKRAHADSVPRPHNGIEKLFTVI